MAMYNSFYGGRRGTSFVIVKNYLDIPQMVNAFAQGNDYTEVNFEEYVIINNPNKNHPDNGKIFRRGYDFNSNRTISGYVLVDKQNHTMVISSDSESYEAALGDGNHTFQLINNIQAHGAEYIGSIIGPAGKAPLLTLSSYEQVQNKHAAEGFEERAGNGLYSPNGENPGLIPGKDSNGNYHDSIEWCYVSVRNDNYGDDTQAYIGFKFPYLVTQMQTSQVSPYDENGDIADMSDIARADDDSGEHPYYNKWHLKIPKGIPGDALRNLRITTFNRYFGDVSNSDERKSPLYYCIKDSEGETIEQELIYPGTNENESRFNRQFFEEKYGTDIVSEGITLNELLNKLTNKAILVYEKYNFDNKQNGEVKYYYLGDYNEIESISLSSDGILTCTLTHDGEKALNTDRIKWISSIELDVPELVTTEPSTIIEEGEQIVIPGTTYIDFKDDVAKNFTVTYNEGSVNEFNIPFVKRIQYNDRTGGLYYQLAGIHSGEDENGNIDGVHLTTLEYIDDVDYDSDSSRITFYYNNYDENESPDNKVEKIIPSIKKIELKDVAYENVYDEQNNLITRPCLVAEYKDSNEENQPINRTEIIADNFDYLESFNYDDNDGSLNYKKKSGDAVEKHILPYVDKLQYDDSTAQIRYHVNGAGNAQYEELEGNLPIIKRFEIDKDTKDIYIQFGTAFNAFEEAPRDEEGKSPYDIPEKKQGEYNPQEHWYRIGSIVSQQVVMGGILTNKKLSDLNVSDYNGAEAYSSEGANPVIQALNTLYPTGYIDDEDTSLRVITVGEQGEFKEYFAYDWMRNKIVSEGDEVTYTGSWYFLGSIKAISNVDLNNGEGIIAEETLSLVYKEDICSISISDITGECTIKNPMTRIQKGHKYTNVITGPFTEVIVEIGGNLFNRYTPVSNQVEITIPAINVIRDIMITINNNG